MLYIYVYIAHIVSERDVERERKMKVKSKRQM